MRLRYCGWTVTASNPEEYVFSDASIGAHRTAMVARARRIVGNSVDAEDVAQEALERAWRFRTRLRPNAPVRPYLIKITMNTALNVLDERLRYGRHAHTVAGIEASAEDAAVQLDTAATIDAAIRELAPAYRAAFVLHDVVGLSKHDIAARRQLPYNTIRTHVLRARRQLRRALTGAAA